MKVTSFRALACSTAAALVFAAPLAQASIVNGGFETGTFSGWTVTSSDDWALVVDLAPHSGTYHAAFGDSGAGSTLSQTFATTAGVSYLVSFWLQLDDSATPNSFSWSWDSDVQLSLSDVSGFDYTEVSAVLTASGASTTLSFNFINPVSFWLLDDVSVTVAVAEPTSASLAAAALLLLAGVRRPRR